MGSSAAKRTVTENYESPGYKSSYGDSRLGIPHAVKIHRRAWSRVERRTNNVSSSVI